MIENWFTVSGFNFLLYVKDTDNSTCLLVVSYSVNMQQNGVGNLEENLYEVRTQSISVNNAVYLAH